MANSGCKWDFNEEKQLTKLFNKYTMSIPDIAAIHMRSSESIRLRLIKLGLIKEDSIMEKEIINLKKEIINLKKENELILKELKSFKQQIKLNDID
jgi:hypothetical protein